MSCDDGRDLVPLLSSSIDVLEDERLDCDPGQVLTLRINIVCDQDEGESEENGGADSEQSDAKQDVEEYSALILTKISARLRTGSSGRQCIYSHTHEEIASSKKYQRIEIISGELHVSSDFELDDHDEEAEGEKQS